MFLWSANNLTSSMRILQRISDTDIRLFRPIFGVLPRLQIFMIWFATERIWHDYWRKRVPYLRRPSSVATNRSCTRTTLQDPGFRQVHDFIWEPSGSTRDYPCYEGWIESRVRSIFAFTFLLTYRSRPQPLSTNNIIIEFYHYKYTYIYWKFEHTACSAKVVAKDCGARGDHMQGHFPLACRSRLQPPSTTNIGIEFYYRKYT